MYLGSRATLTPRSVYYSQVFLTPFMKVSIEAPRESRSFAHGFLIFSLTVLTDAARHTHCTVRVSAPKVVVAARVRGSLHEAVNAASHHLNSPIRQKTCNAYPTMHIHQITFCQLVKPTQQFNKDGCRSLLTRTYVHCCSTIERRRMPLAIGFAQPNVQT